MMTIRDLPRTPYRGPADTRPDSTGVKLSQLDLLRSLPRHVQDKPSVWKKLFRIAA